MGDEGPCEPGQTRARKTRAHRTPNNSGQGRLWKRTDADTRLKAAAPPAHRPAPARWPGAQRAAGRRGARRRCAPCSASPAPPPACGHRAAAASPTRQSSGGTPAIQVPLPRLTARVSLSTMQLMPDLTGKCTCARSHQYTGNTGQLVPPPRHMEPGGAAHLAASQCMGQLIHSGKVPVDRGNRHAGHQGVCKRPPRHPALCRQAQECGSFMHTEQSWLHTTSAAQKRSNFP